MQFHASLLLNTTDFIGRTFNSKDFLPGSLLSEAEGSLIVIAPSHEEVKSLQIAIEVSGTT